MKPFIHCRTGLNKCVQFVFVVPVVVYSDGSHVLPTYATILIFPKWNPGRKFHIAHTASHMHVLSELEDFFNDPPLRDDANLVRHVGPYTVPASKAECFRLVLVSTAICRYPVEC